jgi:hypothetical protein
MQVLEAFEQIRREALARSAGNPGRELYHESAQHYFGGVFVVLSMRIGLALST